MVQEWRELEAESFLRGRARWLRPEVSRVRGEGNGDDSSARNGMHERDGFGVHSLSCRWRTKLRLLKIAVIVLPVGGKRCRKNKTTW